jgi:hypothetical protein
VGVNVKRVAGGAMVVLGMLVPAAPIAHAGGHGDKTQTLRIVAVEIQ